MSRVLFVNADSIYYVYTPSWTLVVCPHHNVLVVILLLWMNEGSANSSTGAEELHEWNCLLSFFWNKYKCVFVVVKRV